MFWALAATAVALAAACVGFKAGYALGVALWG